MTQTSARTELLFSYGTLQLESVQISTFGRTLEGSADALPCFGQSLLKIEDSSVIETSGKTHHPIVLFTGRTSDEVPGVVFEITIEELLNADRYEVAEYKRICATLKSGKRAWVYVDRRFDP